MLLIVVKVDTTHAKSVEAVKRDGTQLFTRRVTAHAGSDKHPIIVPARQPTPVDIFTVKDLQEQEELQQQKLTSTERLLQQIRDELRPKHDNEPADANSVLEWTHIAMVLDRIFLAVFLLTTFMTSLVILLNRPY